MASSLSLACAARGAEVAWVAPTYKNSRPLWRMAERWIQPIARRVKVNRSERIIMFPDGGELGVYTADNPVGLLGNAFDLVIGEEAARWQESVWSETIMPTLADRNGTALLISTPRGRNWFWREYVRGLNGETGYVSFNAPTSANPLTNIRKASELARARTSERTYRQEWLAEFVEDGGGVFRNVRACVLRQAQDALPHPIAGHTYIVGIDWALTHDYTVLIILDATTKTVAYIDRFHRIDYALQRQRIVAACGRFGVTSIIAEENAMGKPNNDELRRAGLPVRDFTTTQTTKATIIESLASAFEQAQITILNDDALIMELESIESRRTASGGVSYAAPEGMHDDLVMALAMAWSGVGMQGQLFY